MKSLFKITLIVVFSFVSVHAIDIIQQVLNLDFASSMAMAAAPVFASFANLRNIDEQISNPAGIRRIGVIAVKDLLDTKIDWPTSLGATPDIDLLTMEVTTAVPVVSGKTVAVITPADNSAFMTFENQGDRYYQSFKHAMGFDLAGLTKAQATEMRKFVNTGAIFFLETNDGDIRVVGSKLSPIVLKSKGDTGKKGGDKRGYALSGDNDNMMTEPPFYKATLAIPGMTVVA